MPAGRFLFTREALIAGASLTLPDDIAHQARDVLRLTEGDHLRLLDGVGGEFDAEITRSTRKAVEAVVGERRAGAALDPVRVTLCLGLLRAAHFEWALQKGTELGVVAFQPLVTERSVAAMEEFGAAKRRRYERILAEAMEQCDGVWLPDLAQPHTLADALGAMPKDVLALIPWEEAAAAPLGVTLARAAALAPATEKQPRHVWLFIGPAGGFSAHEVAMAQAAGALPVTLGSRILRAETAALVATTLTLDALGALKAAPQR